MSKVKETSTHYQNKQTLVAECPEIYAISIIGGQWTLAICCYLINGKLRFGELRERIPYITERMLTLQLRKLEENKLVKRTIYAEVPPRVEYELTSSGKRLAPILTMLELWGEEHRSTMQ